MKKELGKLRRAELLELLLEQTKETERLEKELAGAKEQLRCREIRLNEAGSIAEAALQINDVFVAAQAAAEQYLENIQTLNSRQEEICAEREKSSQIKAEKMVEKAKKQQEKIQEECIQTEESTRRQCEELAERTQKQCEELIQQTRKQCDELQKEAEVQVEKKWETIEERLEKFYETHEELRGLLGI